AGRMPFRNLQRPAVPRGNPPPGQRLHPRQRVRSTAADSAEDRVMGNAPIWKTKSLAEMTQSEWESLCDGCGKCCLLKLEYEDTGAVEYTDVACRLLDPESCRCRSYRLRKALVEDCVRLTPDMVGRLSWLPAT